jgi:hypothetical protein
MDSAERDYICNFLATTMLPARLRAPRSTWKPWSRKRVRDSSKPMPRSPVMKATGLEVDMMEKDFKTTTEAIKYCNYVNSKYSKIIQ